ncbi:hypothetical protein D9758_011090 [Tetrapyrgos nigripes]|uniref:Uncharacterized protein n=1 Tax=Tetrapyrgos nigripes TaxID=182062 RepID=A0A8H5FRQ1_9AGAR|nr:hypothetical protein D9758_011090 [Tetrapyrgos nigripes]
MAASPASPNLAKEAKTIIMATTAERATKDMEGSLDSRNQGKEARTTGHGHDNGKGGDKGHGGFPGFPQPGKGGKDNGHGHDDGKGGDKGHSGFPGFPQPGKGGKDDEGHGFFPRAVDSFGPGNATTMVMIMESMVTATRDMVVSPASPNQAREAKTKTMTMATTNGKGDKGHGGFPGFPQPGKGKGGKDNGKGGDKEHGGFPGFPQPGKGGKDNGHGHDNGKGGDKGHGGFPGFPQPGKGGKETMAKAATRDMADSLASHNQEKEARMVTFEFGTLRLRLGLHKY